MSSTGTTLFNSAIGPIGIAWAPRGIVGLQLPEGSEEATRKRIARRHSEAVAATPPPTVEDAINAIGTLLSGEPVALGFVVFDLDGVPDFDRLVYAAARDIPFGRTLTYGEIATQIGQPGAARAVGKALGSNRFPIVVPCHRVLAADGKAGGFSAHGGVETKMRILSIEKARRGNAPALFDDLPLAMKPRR
jgi:methylated-DNA-[protein]-cysteine S-methyltransferase